MDREQLAAAIDAARSGDERAIATLFAAHQAPLLRFLRAQEPRVADDLAGEVWLAVARGLPRFEGGPADLRAWIFGIARRRVADHRRRGVRRRTDPVDPLDLRERTDPAPGGGGADDGALLRLSAQDAVDLLVRHLGDDQRDVLLLRVLADLDVATTARVLGRSPTWVRTTQQRALQRLARRVAPQERVTR